MEIHLILFVFVYVDNFMEEMKNNILLIRRNVNRCRYANRT